MTDCVIIGGGVIGCAVARELSRFRGDVVLLEKTDDICNGQSKANTAIVHGGYDAKPGTLKARFNVEGNRLFPAVCAELDVPYRNNTSLVVSFSSSEEDHTHLVALYERGIANGLTDDDLELIGAERLHALEPNLNPAATEALLVKNGGICCPYELTVAYAENAAKNGVRFIRNASVTDIRKLPEGGYEVISSAGTFVARAVVNCAGAHSGEIHNLVSENKLSVTARRGEYYLIDKKYAGTFNAAIFQLPSAMGKGILVAPTVDGTILVGPTADDIEDKDDTRTTADGLAHVMQCARLTWPDLPPRGAITVFSGNRAHCTKDDFILGECADAPLFFDAAGVESPGLTSAPAIGRALAKEIAEKLHLEPDPSFDPIRKGIPKFRELDNTAREKLIAEDPGYAKIVCRCELVTEAEIREAIRRPVGARTVDGIKRRTRAGMGRCQAGFCTPRTVEILAEELGISPLEVTKFGGKSKLLDGPLFGTDVPGKENGHA